MTEGFFFIKLKCVLNFRYYLGKLDDELAGDLIYKFELCGIPSKWARAEFDGLILGFYVGEYEVRDINLFYCIGVEGDDGERSLGLGKIEAAEYDGLVLGLYVGEYEVREIN
ncbi:hypothetical protein Tco_0056388 [Tanacetum coccineum]